MQRALRLAALTIWLGGWLAAAIVFFWVRSHADATDLATLPFGPLDEYEVERLGGKATVYAVRLNHWLGGLWHGRPLAYTVAGLSTAAAAACWWIADGIADHAPPPPGATPRGRRH